MAMKFQHFLLIFCIISLENSLTRAIEPLIVCSNSVSSTDEPLVIEVNEDGGTLLAHDQDFSADDFLYDAKLPVDCSWKIALQESPENAGQVVSVNFNSFYLPENTAGEEVEEKEEEGECQKNFVKINLFEDDGTISELGAFCGSGEVPSFSAEFGKPLLIQVHVEEPFRGFNISFSKQAATTVRASGGVSCDEETHFRCPESENQCLPKTYRCDGAADCPNAGDEAGCAEEDEGYNAASGCGSPRKLTGNSGSISTLNYPCNYTSELKCIWEITTAPETKIMIAFNDLFGIENNKNDVDCPFDSVTIYLRESNEVLARLCGNEAPNPYIAPSNEILVVFETDNFDTAAGFRLNWVAISDETVREMIGDERAGKLIDRAVVSKKRFPGGMACRGGKVSTIKILEGVVTSLNYVKQGNKKYPPKMTCRWRFEPEIPEGKRFKHFEFRFNDFDVPSREGCGPAAVTFKYLDEKKTMKLRHRYCNPKRPPVNKAIVMLKPVVEIDFNVELANEKNVGRGVEFEFRVVTVDKAPTEKRVRISSNWLKQYPGCGDASVPKRKAKSRPVESSSRMHRIVGGRPAKPGQWRWPAHLVFQGNTQCGGTVIYPKWILTAAHCFQSPDDPSHQIKGWKVYLGRHVYFEDHAWDQHSPVIEPEVESIFVHSNYSLKSGNKRFDIALVKLKNPVEFGNLVIPLCLPSQPPEAARAKNKNCVVIGWGATKGTGDEGFLNEAEMPIMDIDYCRALNPLYTSRVDREQMICAGFEEGRVDSCQGDSGGPLACENKGKWELQGIVSFGKGCAGEKAPGVYTRVWHFMDWISNVITENVRSVAANELKLK